MKKIATLLAVTMALCGMCVGQDLVRFSDASIQTNGASLATQTPDSALAVNGWIDTVIINVTAGNTETNTVILKTLGDTGTGASRTILTLSNVTGDGVYPVRDLVSGQTGADITTLPARVPLLNDKLRLTATMNGADTNAAAVTMDVYVIITDQP